METKIKKLPSSQIELEVEISAETFDRFIDKAILSLAEKINVPGFRPGKAPRELVIERAGLGVVSDKAAEMAVSETYQEIIKTQKLEPVSRPEINITKAAPGNPFCYKAVFFVLPVIDLPDYQKIAASAKNRSVSVDENEIVNSVEWIRKTRAKLEKLEGQAQKGNFIRIEFSSPQISNGEKQEDGFVLGEGHLAPGFENALIGMKAGEEKVFSLTAPIDFSNKDVAGKLMDFSVKMISVESVELPETNDEFARSLGDFSDWNDLMNKLRANLEAEKMIQERNRKREEIMSGVENECQVVIPQPLAEAEKERRLAAFYEWLENGVKITFADYLAKIKKTEEDFMRLMAEEAEKAVKRFLILREIANKEDIILREEEINEEINKTLSHYSDQGAVQKKVDLERLKSYIEENLRNEKILEKLENLTK